MAQLRRVLKERNFFLLWAGQIISQFGDRLTQMALIGLIYKKAPGSTFELAKLFVFVIVPVFVVGPIAGVYADRWDKKYTMIAADLIRGLLVILMAAYWALSPKLEPVFPIYVIVFIIFSATRFFVPVKMSIIPELVSSDKLLEANSLVHTTGMIAAVLGFGIGGVLIALPAIGAKGALIIDAATFFISAILISCLRIDRKPPELKEGIYAFGRHVKEIIATSVLAEIRYGIRYIFTQRRMHFVIALLFFLWCGVGASYAPMIVFIQTALASVTKHLGLLAMVFGLGLFSGAVIYGRAGRGLSRTRAIFLSLIFGGIFLLQFIIFVNMYKNFYAAAVISFLFGASLSPIMISSNTIVHELIPEDLRGRVFSSLEAVMHLAFLLSMVTASILAELIDTFYILFMVGALFIYFGILGIRKTGSITAKA